MLPAWTRGLVRNSSIIKLTTFSGHVVPGETTFKTPVITINAPNIRSLCPCGRFANFACVLKAAVAAGVKCLFHKRP